MLSFFLYCLAAMAINLTKKERTFIRCVRRMKATHKKLNTCMGDLHNRFVLLIISYVRGRKEQPHYRSAQSVDHKAKIDR